MQPTPDPVPGRPEPGRPVYWGTEYQRIYLLTARSHRRTGR